MQNVNTHMLPALAIVTPLHAIDPNGALCREENDRAMQAHRAREDAARAQGLARVQSLNAALDRLESPKRPTYGALELMERQGGSFAASLACTYRLADAANQSKLADVFGDMFSRYSANAAMLKLNGDRA